MMFRVCKGACLALMALGWLGREAVVADDWPQWMGPQRDNVWRESGIIETFPPQGPQVVWRAEVAGGYSGPAVAAGRVYVTDYVTKENVKVDNFSRASFSGVERVLCLDRSDGSVIWKDEYPVTYGISYPSGPRCTPIVEGNRVYTLGAEGHLRCYDAATGDAKWTKHLPEVYDAKTPLWGYAAHPLIDGERLITLAGGPGTHAVALDKRTGKELWRHGTDREQGYSPPTIIKHGGIRQLILAYPGAVDSVDPETGKRYWSVDYEATNGSIIMSPVMRGDLLYVGGYSNKSLLLRLGADPPAAEVVWRDQRRQGLSPVNVQPFIDGEVMYGFDQDGTLYGVDLETGDRLWKTLQPLSAQRPPRTGTAFMVRNGDRIWMFNELGELLITRLTPEGYEEVDRTKLLEPTNVAFGRRVVWAAPAFAGGQIFLRNDEELICVELRRDPDAS